MQVIRRAFCAACSRDGFRITDWSVQGDHIHLIAEAQDNPALARGVQGFCVRVARGLNGLLERRGPVFVDRYHARILATPREVRNCVAYVLQNARHHGVALGKGQPDPCSSWQSFDGWRTLPVAARDGEPVATAPPRTWLRRVGWRRHGLVRLDEVPGGCR
jgi:REP element-mobilizing transposase RayT